MQHNCSRVGSFLRHRLGRYITNVTRAAESCSHFLCQGNGRCVRRDPQAPHYLHLSGRSYRIRPSADGGFTVSGRPSRHELQLLARRFYCHCYQGYEGERCRSVNDVTLDYGEDRGQEEEQEEEQEEGCGRGHSDAVPTGSRPHLVVSVLLLRLLTAAVSPW